MSSLSSSKRPDHTPQNETALEPSRAGAVVTLQRALHLFSLHKSGAFGLVALSLWMCAACVDEPNVPNPAPSQVWIQRLQPERAQQGEFVTLFGEGFGATFSSDTRVYVSGHCATIAQWSASQVTVRIPHGSGLGDRLIVLQTDGRTSNTASLQILGEDRPPRAEEGCPNP